MRKVVLADLSLLAAKRNGWEAGSIEMACLALVLPIHFSVVSGGNLKVSCVL